MKQLISALVLASAVTGQAQTTAPDGGATRAEMEKAAARYTKVLARNPKDKDAYFNRGVVYSRLGEIPDAIADYNKAIELNPIYREAYYELGKAHVKTGAYGSAVADCNTAIMLKPQVADAYCVRAISNACLGKRANAEDDLRKAVSLKPALVSYVVSVYAHFKWPIPESLAQAAIANDIRHAVRQLDYSESVADECAKMVADWNLTALKDRLVQAKCSLQKSELSRSQVALVEKHAVTALSREILKAASYDIHYFDLAQVVKQHRASCIGYSQLLIVLGNSIGLTVKALDVKESRDGALPPGVAHIANVVDLDDGKVLIVDLTLRFVSEAFVFREQFRTIGGYWQLIDRTNPLAIHQVIRVFERDSLVASLYSNRGFVANEEGRYSEAIACCTKAIELEPSIAETFTIRGRAYSGMSQYKKAVIDFTKAIEIDPKHATAYFNRGVACARQGKIEEARNDLRTAAKMQPLLERHVKAASEKLNLGL